MLRTGYILLTDIIVIVDLNSSVWYFMMYDLILIS